MERESRRVREQRGEGGWHSGTPDPRYGPADQTHGGPPPAGRPDSGNGHDHTPPPVEERRTLEDRRVEYVPVERERRMEPRRTVERTPLERRRYGVARAMQAVDYLFYLLYGLLAIRFVLALLGAGEQAGFVRFITGLTDPFYAPFAGIVSRPSVNGGFLDFPVLIALLAYALLHLAVRGLLRLIASGSEPGEESGGSA